MYIRITKNQKGDAYYHLVESYREQGKVKQRTLLSLGRVEEGKLEQLAEAIGKHLDTMTAVEFAKHVDISQTYLYGPLYLLQRMAERLGIEKILKQIAGKHERLTFDFYNIVFSLIASRFIRPMSKLGFYEHILDRLYPGIVSYDIDLQHIYRSMDLLNEHKEEIEQSLFFHQKDLFSLNVDVVLYDLTTLRFESTRVDQGELPRFGYSKEMRSDCTQLVFGLLTDTDGIPLGFEAFPGNTFEGKTLDGIVDKLHKKFNVRRFIFVADRGLFSPKNLDYIRDSDGSDVVAGGWVEEVGRPARLPAGRRDACSALTGRLPAIPNFPRMSVTRPSRNWMCSGPPEDLRIRVARLPDRRWRSMEGRSGKSARTSPL